MFYRTLIRIRPLFKIKTPKLSDYMFKVRTKAILVINNRSQNLQIRLCRKQDLSQNESRIFYRSATSI